MKSIIIPILLIVVAIAVYLFVSQPLAVDQNINQLSTQESMQNDTNTEEVAGDTMRPIPDNLPNITAIDHASAVVEWGDVTVFVDPVGEQAQYAEYGTPDIVIITHIHPDHLSVDTMIGMLSRETVVLAPQSVIDEVPEMIANNVITPFAAGTAQEVMGITFTAIPAYNLRPEAQQYHPRERGDIGVVMEESGTRVYFSGDTEGTPEMLALENIDTAIVAMNLPFTMSVEDAAQAVATFAPRVVIPYHYRSRDGMSDLDAFERLLNELNPAVQVERMDWYQSE